MKATEADMWELSIDSLYSKIMRKEGHSESETRKLEKILACLQELRNNSGKLKNFADIYQIVKEKLDETPQFLRAANEAVNILAYIREVGLGHGITIVEQTPNGFILDRPISEARLHELNLALRTRYPQYSQDLRMGLYRHQDKR